MCQYLELVIMRNYCYVQYTWLSIVLKSFAINSILANGGEDMTVNFTPRNVAGQSPCATIQNIACENLLITEKIVMITH